MNCIKIYYSILLVVTISVSCYAQDVFKRPDPPRLVNDFAKILTSEEVANLENKLVEFDKTSSTQITIVTVKDLNGYDVNQLAYEIGQKWGVGQKGKNNGIVILLKPKTAESRGYVSIQVAYGLEDVVTDALSNRIIETEMIPYLKKNGYYGGFNAAVNVLIDITRGKYTADQYSKKQKNNPQKGSIFFLLLSFVLILIIAIAGRNKRSQQQTLGRRGSDIPFWMLMGGMMGSSRGSGSNGWGNFSSGSGSFGGFGGGSFGGGGASGSW